MLTDVFILKLEFVRFSSRKLPSLEKRSRTRNSDGFGFVEQKVTAQGKCWSQLENRQKQNNPPFQIELKSPLNLKNARCLPLHLFGRPLLAWSLWEQGIHDFFLFTVLLRTCIPFKLVALSCILLTSLPTPPAPRIILSTPFSSSFHCFSPSSKTSSTCNN